MKRTIISIMVFTSLALGTSELWAHHTSVCSWTGERVRWLESPVYRVDATWGTTSACNEFSPTFNVRNDFNCAVDAWRKVGSATPQPTTVSDWDGASTWNFDSEVYFFHSGDIGGGQLATNWTKVVCVPLLPTEIVAGDIGFDADFAGGWDYYSPAPGGDNYDSGQGAAFRAVALHEVGHTLGLSLGAPNHEDDELAVMNTNYPDGGWSQGEPIWDANGHAIGLRGRFWPQADDCHGLTTLNPSGLEGRDLAAVRAWYDLGDPDGSAEDLNSVFPNSICPGQSVTVQYTIENRGANALNSAKIRVYFSTNPYITPSDIASTTFRLYNMAAFSSVTSQYNFFLPSSMPPGQYYVGYYVDPNNGHPGEVSETYNNSVTLPVIGSTPDTTQAKLTVRPSGQCP